MNEIKVKHAKELNKFVNLRSQIKNQVFPEKQDLKSRNTELSHIPPKSYKPFIEFSGSKRNNNTGS